jgi:hypothetical protein
VITFLRNLAIQATDVLSYWLTPHPHVGADALWADVTAPRDAVERLADKEAEEEVTEPSAPDAVDIRNTMTSAAPDYGGLIYYDGLYYDGKSGTQIHPGHTEPQCDCGMGE